MEEAQPPKREKLDAQEDRLVELLSEFLFDKNMRPRKGRKELLLGLISENEIPPDAVSPQVQKIIEPIYKIPQHLRKDYLETLIRRINIGMSTIPKGPLHQNLLRYLSMVELETYAKGSVQTRNEVDRYYQEIFKFNPLSNIQRKILNAILHKDIKKLKLALSDPTFQDTDLDPVGIFDPLLYAHLNNFQDGLNTIYSNCVTRYATAQNRFPPSVIKMNIRTHQNAKQFFAKDFYEFSQHIDFNKMNHAELLAIARNSNNRKMVNDLCIKYGFLRKAIEAGDLKTVKDLIEHGADPMSMYMEGNYYGQTTHYQLAVATDQNEIAKHLIDHASVHAISHGDTITGLSPLQYACRLGNIEIAQYLLNILPSAVINTESFGRIIQRTEGTERTVSGNTALYFACDNEDSRLASELANLLLEKNANPDTANDQGETPLFAAYRRGNLKLAEILIDKGANPLRLLGPVNYKFNLKGSPENEVNHVTRIQKDIPLDLRENLLIKMLERYLNDHKRSNIAQRLLNSLNSTEPSITTGDKIGLFIAPKLGKIYTLAKPFLVIDYHNDMGGQERETDYLLVGDDESRAPSALKVAAHAIRGQEKIAPNNAPVLPRSPRAKFGLEVKVDQKSKEDAHKTASRTITPRKE